MTLRLIQGDCREVLPSLAAGSAQCCVTSPPYWGLRSYLPNGHADKRLEIGSEPTVEAWVRTLVEVSREVRRVLRDDGTLWLNLGDSYAGSWGAHTGSIPAGAAYKPKDLIGQPWLLAFALRADGWYLRQEIIWHKPGPMPESVRDRCTKAHEHIFLLTKRPDYYWNFEAVQEPVNGGAHARGPGNRTHGKYSESLAADGQQHRTKAGLVANAERARAKYKTPDGWDTRTGEGGHGSFHAEGREKGRKLAQAGSGTKNNASFDAAMAVMPDTRNPRSVWTIPSEPFKGAHFACFPRELARRCIAAGSREGDTVLDPFAGSGTVGLVADQMRRDAILIDLDERNQPMATERIMSDSPLFAQVCTG